MSRNYKKISNTEFASLKPKDKDYKFFLGDGLYALITTKGSKLFYRKYRLHGKESTLSFGKYPIVSLAQARELNFEASKLIAKKINPQKKKRDEKQQAKLETESTLHVVAKKWHEIYKTKVMDKTAKDTWYRLEKNVFPELGDKPIASITRREIGDLISEIQDRGAVEIGRRMHKLIETILEFALDKGYIDANPCARSTKSLKVNEKDHYACFDSDELPAFLCKLYTGQSNMKFVTECAMKLMLFTFVRTNELVRAKWNEFDFDKKVWTVPAERMKGKKLQKKLHLVPLSKYALEILRKLQQVTGDNKSGYLFPNNHNPLKPMSNGALLAALKRMGYRGIMTGHGFRTLALTHATEKLNYRLEVPDRQLAHASKSMGGAYDRGSYIEDRVKLMNVWSNYLNFIEKNGWLPNEEEVKNIIKFTVVT